MNSNLEAIKQKKLNQFYPIKGEATEVMDVDFNKRTVQFIGNTYNFVDSDLDILVTGAAKRTIQNRGPQSKASAKIKHLADHKMQTDKMVGLPVVLEETTIDGKEVIYCESKIPSTVVGDDHLVKYQTGIYDNHSIGFRYVDIELAEKEAEGRVRYNYDKYYPELINPEKVDEIGYFWVVKEIELFEISVVTFGANSLTPVTGFKGVNKDVQLNQLFTRLNDLQSDFRNALETGNKTKDQLKTLDLQIKQIKQVMSDLFNQEPSKKDTPPEDPSSKQKNQIDYDYLLNNL